MAIPGQQLINIGQPNDPANSDSLYTAFNIIQNNFTELFSSAGEIQTLIAGNGISISNSSASSFVITNTGVTTLVAGENVTITTLGGSPASNGTLVINSTGTGNGNGGGSVNSVGVTSDTLTVTNSPVISSGNIVVDLPTITGVSGSYSSANIVVDEFGRVISATNGGGSGTVTSVAVTAGTGLSVSGSPITTSGTINMVNTGVTSIVAGSGVSINQSTGAVTISSTGGGGNGGGTVTRVGVLSSSLNVTGSPITTSGNITIDLPSTLNINQINTNQINANTGNINSLNVTTPNSNSGLTISTSSNDYQFYGVVSKKSRGTNSLPTAVQTDDVLMNFQSMGYTSYNKYQNGGLINIIANGVASSGSSYIPTIAQIKSTSTDMMYEMKLDDYGNLIIPGRMSQHMYSNIASQNTITSGRARGTDSGNIAIVQTGDTLYRYTNFGYTGNGLNTIDTVPGWSFGGSTETQVTGAPASPGAYIPSSYLIKTVSLSNVVHTFTFAGSGNLFVQEYVIANTIQSNGNVNGSNASLGNLVSANYYAGTLTTAAQPNITSVGTLSSLSVTNNITAGNVYANSGTIGASLLTGTITTAAQPNITSVGTLSSLSVTNNITAGNVYANSGTIRGSTVTAIGNVNSGNASLGNLATANFFAGTLTTAAQPNITSVGTLGSLDVTGNISAGNVNISGNIVSNTVGTPTFVSSTSITLQAPTVVNVTGGAVFRMPSLTTTQRLAVSAVNGDMCYDSDLGKMYAFTNGTWSQVA